MLVLLTILVLFNTLLITDSEPAAGIRPFDSTDSFIICRRARPGASSREFAAPTLWAHFTRTATVCADAPSGSVCSVAGVTVPDSRYVNPGSRPGRPK